MQTAYFAGGCFWCIEAIFQRIQGVEEVLNGYCNGNTQNPNYEQVCTGKTRHAEVVKINFNENIISYRELLDIFFKIHDPTTLNRQGLDVGSQYRSAVFYINKEQEKIAKNFIVNTDGTVTELVSLDIFYVAEKYHQNYYNNNKNENYCKMVVLPKIKKYFK